MSDPVRKLCGFVATQSFEEIPRATIEHAKRVVMDTVGVILAGSQDPHLERLAGLFAPSERQRTSTRLGHREKLSAMDASLLNGAAGSTREFEEGHNKALGHPAIQLVPAALSFAESVGASGKRLLEGVILGYEVAGRIGSSAPLRRGFHPSGTWGTVGAAATVGKISGLEASEIFELLNIASSLGITSYTDNAIYGKNISQMYAALANYFGIFSYYLYRVGFQASPRNLQVTFGQLVSDRMREDRLVKGLGEGYFIEKNYFKMYPSCRFTHSALDALRKVLRKAAPRIEEIDRIDVYTFKWALEMANPKPDNIGGLRFSIPHLLGLYLITGSVSLKTMEEYGKYAHEVEAIAAKTFLHEDEKMNQELPVKRGARIVVSLSDGTKIEGSVDDCEGGQLYPYADSLLEAKFLDLATPVLGEKRAKEALSLLKELEALERIEPLGDLLGLRREDD